MAFPFTYFPDPSSSGSVFSLDELERERKRKQLEALTKNASQMAIGEPPPFIVPPQRSIEELNTGLNGVRQLPNTGPEPRFGLARFFLGDRQAPPLGATATDQFNDLAKRGPGREGFLRGLGNLLVPGAMRAFTDTYDEKLERLGSAAKMEQANRQLDLAEDYRKFLREQDASSTNRANIRADWEQKKAAEQAREKLGVAKYSVLKAALSSDATLMPEQEALAFYGDPDVIVTPWGNGQVMVRKTQGAVKGEVAKAQFDNKVAPSKEMDRETAFGLQDKRNEGALAAQKLRNANSGKGASTALDRVMKAAGEGAAASIIAEYGGEANRDGAMAAVYAAVKDGVISEAHAPYAIAYARRVLGAKKEDIGNPFAVGGGAPPVSTPPAKAPKTTTAPRLPVQDDVAEEAKRQIGGKPNKRITLSNGVVTRRFRTDASGNIREE